MAYANSVWDAVEAGHITWTNASTNWVGGDLVITYQTGEGSLHLPGYAHVWALAVGGGGSGGGGYYSTGRGGSGGGGAGGYVENKTLVLQGGEGAAGDYAIIVGAGGAAVKNADKTSGNPGGGTSFLAPDSSQVLGVLAAGGGAGATEDNGGAGASGGGASAGYNRRGAVAKTGGSATQAAPGIGNKGGDSGAFYLVGGGGGGAGGAGAAATATQAGNGGAGKSSDITGETKWYAAGGGGGYITTGGAAGLGGSGVGGNGGSGSGEEAKPGVDGTGSGGGGGRIGGSSGKGGDGVVIVRISWVHDGPVEKPKSVWLPYTGEEIVAGRPEPNVYTVSGEYAATNVNASDDPYTYTATLEPGIKWSDNTDAPVDVDWWIVPGTNSIPTPLFKSETYDGENHRVVGNLPPKTSFVDGSVWCATNVGEYAYTVKLDDPNYRWSDGSVTNQTFNWSITPRPITPQPLPTGLVYAGTNVVAVTNNPNYVFAAGSVTSATNAGNYKVIFKLADPDNNCWPDGTTEDQTFWWSIARMPVDYPPVPGDDGNFTYDGTTKVAATNTVYYTLGVDPVRPGYQYAVQAKARGDYYCSAVLGENWCWKDDGSIEPYQVLWHILQAKNEITKLKMSDWQIDQGPKPDEPSIAASFGANTVTYSYGKSTSGPWLEEMPSTTGVFYVRAFIKETSNWTSAEKTKRFLVYKSFDELFTDYVDIAFTNFTGTGIYDYRALVKISETIYRGFSYARCPDGEGLAFMNLSPGQEEAPLSFDVDTWNTAGDSYVWVKLPLLDKNTKIRMYWHLKEGMEAPGSSPEETWSGYAGVWHFSEAIASAAAPTAPSHDATGNGYDALPRKAASTGNLQQMISTAGQIGAARINANMNYGNGGNHLVVSNFTSCALGTNFVFEGWVKFDNYLNAPWIVGRKTSGEEGGWAMVLNATDRKKFDLYGGGTTPKVSDQIASQELKNGWVHVTWAVSGAKYWLYTRSPDLGSYAREGTLNSPAGDDLAQLTFGSDLSGLMSSVNGKFDEFRLRPWTVSKTGPTAAQIAAVTNELNATYANTQNPTEFVNHGWVVKEGKNQNYWVRHPSISKTRWERGEAMDYDEGEAAEGAVKVAFRNIFKGGSGKDSASPLGTTEQGGSGILSASEQDDPSASHPPLPTEAGNYIATFSVTVDGFDQLVEEIAFTIIDHEPYFSVGTTEEGRILLANDDSQGDWTKDSAITNQSYWLGKLDYYNSYLITNGFNIVTNYDRRGRIIYPILTNAITVVCYPTNSTYWVHSGESTHDADFRPYLLTNSIHTLETTNVAASLCGGTRLWHLNQVRIGNLYMDDLLEWEDYNFLPLSLTACAISTNAPPPITKAEIGNLMFRNTKEACIYSPCYTNGIGTIYFDAVNYPADKRPQNYHLVLEVATNVMNGTAIPSDANLTEITVTTNNIEDVEGSGAAPDVTVTTNINYALADWQAVSVVPRKFVNGACTTEAATQDIVLDMQKGGSNQNFYRFTSMLNWTLPMRFRIRRTEIDPAHDVEGDRDAYGQILLDNVIASKPNVVKGATAAKGWFDIEKRGKQALGYENTWQTPFPAIGDAIIARAELDGGGSNYVTKAVMHYRERYLNQRIGSAGSGKDSASPLGWREVVLNPYNDFKALEPLDLSGLPGDIEFYFTSDLQSPFYAYVDYSGANLGVPGFTEEITAIENRCTELSAETSQSRGTDWFVRLREGASDWEGLVLRTDASDPARREIQMELISDHIWRGYFKTVDGIAGGLRYRIEPRNLQEPGSRGFALNTNFWYAADDTVRMPVSAILKTDGTTNSWARIPCDGTTGYLMFQVDDRTKSISIVHADYQDFDYWNDANKNPPVFVGNSTVDGKKSGVSPKMQEFTTDFTYRKKPADPLRPWTATPSVNTNWTETFETGSSQEYADYVPFGSATTISGWKSGPGMFVYAWYRYGKDKDGKDQPIGGYVQRALQMEGCGKGLIQFPPAPDPLPRGLAEVSFTARLGQFINIDEDISFAEVPSVDTMVTKNYAFVTLAAFDLNSNNDFAGDASLSLFAYYRVRKGAYEVRLEQVGAAIASDGKTVTGPSNTRRLSLYRWTPDGSGKVEAKLLGSKDITFAAVKTQGETGSYTPFYISCETEAAATVIKFGIYRNDTGNDNTAGRGIAYDKISEISGRYFYSMVYRDTKDERLKSGTYGVLSSNCDGVFFQPHVTHQSIATAKTDKDKLVEDGNNAKIAFPSLTPCQDDIVDEDDEEPWNHNEGRMESYVGEDVRYQWGIRACPVKQTLDLQLSPRGKDTWKTVQSFEFDDFGSAGKAGKACSCRLDRTADYDMRLKVKGEINDPRTDVIVDDLKLTQWRGCDYGDPDTSDFIDDNDRYGWRSSFTFSSGWVKNEVSGGKTNATVLLSAKRTAGWDSLAKASAIRSPLMDGEGLPARGIGLGLFSFGYRNAQENAKLLVQIATNNIGSSALGYDTNDPEKWTTVTNVDFSAMTPAERQEGTVAVYLGLHGVKGLMRVCVDPKVTEQVHAKDGEFEIAPDASKYGEVEITSVYCRDEPPLDLTAWWGWNLQTTDHKDRQYLVDNAKFASGANGLSLGLNRGIDKEKDNVEDDPETYKRQMPFVQTPLFESNTVGEITFRARQYELKGQSQYAEVALYGADFRPGTHDLDWKCSPADRPLARFVVSNATYTTYTYKTKPGEGYKAFRLGVTGIKAVDEETRGPDPTQGETPVRVLIDEVLVSEAIRPEMGFRSCLPVRSELTTSLMVAGATRREEQPIMGDAWSVQAEIEVKLLPDEIDLSTPAHRPRVFFHWFCGEKPWGYAAWRDRAVDKKTRGFAELKRAEGEEMVFKGSYVDAADAVVMAEPSTATYTYRVYQYAAEVVYWDVKGNCITSILDRADWTRPEWYAPLDLNAANGGGAKDGPFAAYNILESVAPGRAWINEANVFDGRDAGFNYPAAGNQYVEVAVPITQSLRNWKLYLVNNNMTTNLLCIFGQDGVVTSKSVNTTNNYAFVTVQSPATKRAGTLDASKGQVDGTWATFGGSDKNGELDQVNPIGLRLVRPSGIVAHEIALEGTNTWGGTAYADRYSLERQVEKLNAADPEKLWYAAGNEYGGLVTTSLGVTNLDVAAARASAVTPRELWTNRGVKTPGRVNAGQVIPEGYAIFPSGDMVLVNATVSGAHILQTVGDVTNSTVSVLVATPKDGDGTNITYCLDSPWFEVGEIRENGVLKAAGGPDGFVFAAGKKSSESVVTVTATARPRSDLRDKYGLTPENPYTDAVIAWLEGGRTMKGEFAYPGSIDLPIYRDYPGNYVTNLTLTETYWFDIDPTGSNWCYRAGTVGIPGEVYVNFRRGADGRLIPDPDGDVVKTNVRTVVYMVITNESPSGVQAELNWAPYVLRSKVPGLDSQMYARGETNTWDAVNFKITADIINGMPLRQKWIPLRYFIFTEGSFDANYRATIDIPHPFSADSLSVNYGWKEYAAHPEKWTLGFGWSIDPRVAPVAIETLAPTNAITW